MNNEYCPICEKPKANKGSKNIKVCENCAAELSTTGSPSVRLVKKYCNN